MKKSLLWVVLVAGLLPVVLSIFPTSAQQSRAAAPAAVRPVGIALLDLAAVFKQHPGYKARMDELEQTARQLENQLKTEQAAIKQLAQQLEGLTDSSPEHKQLELQLTERQAKLQVHATTQRKELGLAEAKVHHQIYQEIEQEVASIAAANSIAVVLRYNAAPVNGDKPTDIYAEVNKSVIYSAPGLDITSLVLERLKAHSPVNRQGGGSMAR